MHRCFYLTKKWGEKTTETIRYLAFQTIWLGFLNIPVCIHPLNLNVVSSCFRTIILQYKMANIKFKWKPLFNNRVIRLSGRFTSASFNLGFSGSARGKESPCQYRRFKRRGFDPRVGKIHWSRKWHPAPGFLPGKFHEQRSLARCSP